jgi:hypothetical protein
VSAQFGGRYLAIVGGPRCGTTSLARWLREHPDICFSNVKEPHFFTTHDLGGEADEDLRRIVGEEYLDRYFPHCGGGDMLAEGSVSYLYAPERIEPVLRLWPDAKFIIGVRDPMRMLPSLHQRLLVTGDENVRDFDRAWQLVSERRAGRHIPRSCIDPRFLDYESSGRLGTFVGRFFEIIGRDRCFVVVHDDLVADPAKVYREMLAFLGLAEDGRVDFRARRSAKGFKLAWLQRLLKRPPVATRAVLAGEKFRERVKPIEDKQPGRIASAVLRTRKRLLRWNKAPAPPIHVSPEVRRDIAERLRGEVAELGRLLGRDFGHWLATEPPQKTASPGR